MKKTLPLLMIIVIALSLSGCNRHITAWGLSTPNLDSADNDLTGRVGLCSGDVAGDTEVGIEINYVGVHNKPTSYGMYGVYHLGGDPKSWLGQPYAAYRLGTDGDGGNYYGPELGTIYWETFVIYGRVAQEFTGKLRETHNDENDEELIGAGLRFVF